MGIVQKESTKQSIVYYIGAALGYLNKILLFTHFLSTDQVGLVNVFTSISAVYAQFAVLGTPTVSLRFFPFFQNKEKKHHGFFFWGNMAVMAGFLISSLIFIVFKSFILGHYNSSSSLFARYYYYIIPLALASTYYLFFDAYLRSLLKTVVSTVMSEVIVKLMISGCVALYALNLVSFDQFVTIYVLCNCTLPLVLLLYIAFLKQLYVFPGENKLIKRLSGLIIVYGIFTILSTLGGSILLYVDTIMVSAQLGLNQAGVYSTVFLLSTILSFPYRAITKIAHPLIGRFWKERKMKEMAEFYSKTTLVSLVIGGALILLVLVNLDAIFSILPKEYNNGKPTFIILCLAKYLDMVCGLNNIITLTSKKFRYDMYFSSALVVLTIVMNLVFIPIYGIGGAALATAASIVIINIFRLWFVQHYFGMQPFSLNSLWVFLITLLVFGLAVLLPGFHNIFLSIAVNSAVVTLLFMGSILLLKLSPDINLLVYKFTKLKFLLPHENKTTSN